MDNDRNRWTEAEDITMTREYKKRGTKELAKRLGRTPEAIRWRARKLRLSTYNRGTVRTVRLQFLKDVEDRLAEVPEDTRTTAQQILGEPLPGRSALDRKLANGEKLPT
jgi:hypothetical protein